MFAFSVFPDEIFILFRIHHTTGKHEVAGPCIHILTEHRDGGKENVREEAGNRNVSHPK